MAAGDVNGPWIAPCGCPCRECVVAVATEIREDVFALPELDGSGLAVRAGGSSAHPVAPICATSLIVRFFRPTDNREAKTASCLSCDLPGGTQPSLDDGSSRDHLSITGFAADHMNRRRRRAAPLAAKIAPDASSAIQHCSRAVLACVVAARSGQLDLAVKIARQLPEIVAGHHHHVTIGPMQRQRVCERVVFGDNLHGDRADDSVPYVRGVARAAFPVHRGAVCWLLMSLSQAVHVSPRSSMRSRSGIPVPWS